MKRPVLFAVSLLALTLLWGAGRLSSLSRERWLASASVEVLQAELAARHDSPNVLGRLGNLYVRSGRMAEAQPLLAKALDLDPSSGERWVDLSRALPDDGQAIAKLQEGIHAFPDCAAAKAEIARRTLATGDAVSARKQAEQVTREHPECADAWEALGEVLAALRRGEEAEQAFGQALALRDRAQARLALAKLLVSEQKYDRLEMVVGPVALGNSGLDVVPAERYRGVVFWGGARLHGPLSEAELRDLSSRLSESERAANSLPPDERMLPAYFVGESLFRQGKPAEAIPHLERCVALGPTFPGGLYSLARAYRLTGRIADADAMQKRHAALASALGDMDRANILLEKRPDDPDGLLLMARALANLGDGTAARNLCRHLLTAKSHEHQAASLLADLDKKRNQ